MATPQVRDPSPAPSGGRRSLLLPLSAAFAVFAADLLAPAHLQVAVFYVVIVTAASRLAERGALLVAITCTVLVAVASLPRMGPEIGPDLPGRVAVAAALWAVVGIQLRRWRREGVLDREQTFRALLEAAPDAMVIVDERGSIVLVNTQTERLFGYDRRELLGQPVERLIPGDLRERHHAHRKAFAQEPRTRTMGEGLELAALRKDGSTFPVDIALGPLASELGTLVSAAIRDVTERNRTERAMRDFLATLGHELRNPMAAISNATRLLRHPAVTAEQIRWSEDILEAEGRHMTRLIDDLLDLSRVARNTIELRREVVVLSRIVDRVLDSTRSLLEERAQSISVEMPRQVIRIEADPVRLTQVFSNLVDNAAKYSPPGTAIEVRVRCESGQLAVSVRDQGQGIGRAALPRVFDMFYRADRSLERHEGGLGIGLTLVRQLVDLHGGTVEAASPGPGLGSTFTVRLPVLEEGPASDPTAASMASRGSAGALPVLVVDDNRRAADSLALLLRLDGHEVTTAYDGPEALAAAERSRPRIALLDIGMPGMNGYDLARRLREQPWSGNTYLVALTGLGTPEDRQRAEEAGFDKHLVKPVDLEALQKIIDGIPPVT